ncbi:MAG: CHAT domain-containing protein [Cyanobium sp.]
MLSAILRRLGALPLACTSWLVLAGISHADAASLSAIAQASVPPSPSPALAVYQPTRYTPAILRINFSNGLPPGSAGASARPASFLDVTLLPLEGPPIGKRVPITTAEFATLLRNLYSSLSRQEELDVANPTSPARVLHSLLIGPIAADLERLGVTTLMITADQGLQAVPLAALHDGRQFFGERYAFSLTPAVGLTSLQIPANPGDGQQLGAGASRFVGLAPLPLVPQELQRVSSDRSRTFLDGSFTPSVLTDRVADSNVNQVHVATHAEFLPGGPSQAKLFTGTEPFSLTGFASLRQRRNGQLLDLISLSACRTALGDKDSELGFAGLALQAGSRSAIGTLWYVDDVATSAFFVQFYRLLRQGLPKAEALQATRQAMASGAIRLQGDQVVGPDGATLIERLSPLQQRRVQRGLQNPFFWAGITLLGTPW